MTRFIELGYLPADTGDFTEAFSNAIARDGYPMRRTRVEALVDLGRALVVLGGTNKDATLALNQLHQARDANIRPARIPPEDPKPPTPLVPVQYSFDPLYIPTEAGTTAEEIHAAFSRLYSLLPFYATLAIDPDWFQGLACNLSPDMKKLVAEEFKNLNVFCQLQAKVKRLEAETAERACLKKGLEEFNTFDTTLAEITKILTATTTTNDQKAQEVMERLQGVQASLVKQVTELDKQIADFGQDMTQEQRAAVAAMREQQVYLYQQIDTALQRSANAGNLLQDVQAFVDDKRDDLTRYRTSASTVLRTKLAARQQECGGSDAELAQKLAAAKSTYDNASQRSRYGNVYQAAAQVKQDQDKKNKEAFEAYQQERSRWRQAASDEGIAFDTNNHPVAGTTGAQWLAQYPEPQPPRPWNGCLAELTNDYPGMHDLFPTDTAKLSANTPPGLTAEQMKQLKAAFPETEKKDGWRHTTFDSAGKPDDKGKILHIDHDTDNIHLVVTGNSVECKQAYKESAYAAMAKAMFWAQQIPNPDKQSLPGRPPETMFDPKQIIRIEHSDPKVRAALFEACKRAGIPAAQLNVDPKAAPKPRAKP